MSAHREFRVNVGWGRLAAVASGDPEGQRLLCLHGWMDNAASFAPLANALPEFHWVALDYAGHGASDHRHGSARYYFTDYLFDLDAVLDDLDWDRCTLISHSLGAGIANCYACADPQRVERIVMLDGLGVVTEAPNHAAQRLTRSLHSVRHPRDHRRVFASVELAARVRQLKNPMDDTSARLLAERALREADGGWRWRTDPGAMWDSPYWMSEPHALNLLKGVKCPVMVVVTPYLERYLGDRLAARLDALDDVTVLRVDGGHHVHLDAPERLAEALHDFLTCEDLQHD